MSSLLTVWKTNRDFVEDKGVQQVLAMCGDGCLRDDGHTSAEFRQFLEQVPAALLVRFADECLQKSFDSSGLVLQDVINQIGTRLGFIVEHGRYRGASGHVGFDGIWSARDGYSILIEVKTTDAYRINLEVISGYRRRLVEQGRLKESLSSILLVVGRQDTGDLEAQIRGSRHAWDARLISVDALCRLTKVRENFNEPATGLKINQLLKPREFTRLDPIIDLIFDTYQDAEEQDPTPEATQSAIENPSADVQFDTAKLRRSAVDAVARHLATPLIAQSRSVFSTADQKTSVVCLASKRYVRGGGNWFWFTLRQSHLDYLSTSEQGIFCLACGSTDRILLIPKSRIVELLPEIRNNEGNNWQVEIDWEDQRVFLNQPRTEVTRYVLKS